jgi:hypothetical protein
LQYFTIVVSQPKRYFSRLLIWMNSLFKATYLQIMYILYSPILNNVSITSSLFTILEFECNCTFFEEQADELVLFNFETYFCLQKYTKELQACRSVQ